MAFPQRPSVTEPAHWVEMTQRSVPPPPTPGQPHHDPELQMQPYIPAGTRMQPYYAGPYQMVPRHFAFQAPYPGEPIIELNDRFADMVTTRSNDVLQLNRRANEQEDEIDDVKQIVKNDLRVLEQRINTFIEQQKQQSSSKASRNPPRSDPSLDEEPIMTQNAGRIVCETKDAIVDVVVQHIDEVRAQHDRIDSAYGSPIRAPSSTPWRPIAIRKLPVKSISKKASHHHDVFSWDFLRDLLGGQEWSPGYYFNCSKDCILPTRAYWMVDLKNEPFMPRTPGEHGAKLTAFFNATLAGHGKVPDEGNYKDTPVFVSSDGGKMYRYVGNYSKKRYSDKVGYDTMMEHIPQSVLQFHANQLAQVGRPAWVTECLRNHFWPKPTYEGPIPSDSSNDDEDHIPGKDSKSGNERDISKAFESYANKLKEWQKSSTLKVNLLRASSIVKAFNSEDAQSDLSLRLRWEYLECVDYEDDFYDMLATLSKASSARYHPLKSCKPNDTASSHIFSPTPKPPLPQSPLYGARAKALQKRQWRENPGVDASSLPELKWSAPTFDSPPHPPSKPVSSAGRDEKVQTTTESSNPFSGKCDLNAAKAFAAGATTAQPRTNNPYSKKATAVAAAAANKAASSNNNTYPTYPPTPAFGEIPSKASTEQPVTTSQNDVKKTKAVAPHLRRAEMNA